MIVNKDQDSENKINAIVRNRTAVNTSFKKSKLALAGFIVSKTKTCYILCGRLVASGVGSQWTMVATHAATLINF